jgi:hypothetical protein
MASKRKNGTMGAKRKPLASSSDDEENKSGFPNNNDEDDKPLFGFYLKDRQLRRRTVSCYLNRTFCYLAAFLSYGGSIMMSYAL